MSGPAKARVRQKIEHHNFIAVEIGVRALVDTGAFSSCVSLSLVKRLKLESRVVSVPQRKRLFTADGKAVHVLDTIQEFKIPVIFCLVPHLQFDVILGVDFFRQTEAKIDMESQIVTLYNDLVGTNLSNDTDIILRMIDAVLIGPTTKIGSSNFGDSTTSIWTRSSNYPTIREVA